MYSDSMMLTLGDCSEWASGGTPSKQNPEFWSGSIPWVSAKDMKKFRLYDAQDHISESALSKGGKLTPEGSILLLVRGMTLHNDVPICVAGRPMAFNQDLKAIRPKAGVDGAYLVYWLLSRKPELLAAVDHAGHGTGRLVTDRLKKMLICVPSISAQQRVAKVFSALDDKIESNNRMNDTIEAIVRALFQHKFIDEIAEGLPVGWSKGVVSDIGELNREAITPGKFPNKIFSHYSLPAFDEGRLPKQEAGSEIMSNKTLVPTNSVLISKLNPRIPRIWLPATTEPNRAISSTEFLVVSPRSGGSREFLYCMFANDSFMSKLATMVTGTSGSHQRIRPDSLLDMQIVIPSKAAIRDFTNAVAPMLQRVQSNIEQSRTLANLRDTLLPKLLNGELSLAKKPPKI